MRGGVTATVHPSYILRVPERQDDEYRRFVDDLRFSREQLRLLRDERIFFLISSLGYLRNATNAFDEFWRRVTVDGEVSFRSVFQRLMPSTRRCLRRRRICLVSWHRGLHSTR